MKKIAQFLYMVSIALLLTALTGCGSTGYSGSSSYYHGNSWRYDNYYRSGVNRHHNRSSVTRANISRSRRR